MKGAQRPRRPYPNAARQRRDENKPKFVDNNQLFIDQFVNLKKCLQPRTYVQVAKDMYPLWKANPLLCTKFTAYTRMITRKCRITTPEGVIQLDTQQGEGLKNEGIMRMLWLAIYHKPTFHANIAYFAAAGCWKGRFRWRPQRRHRWSCWGSSRNCPWALRRRPQRSGWESR